MAKITIAGLDVIVSNRDLPIIRANGWGKRKHRNGNYYIISTNKIQGKKQYLHRMVLGVFDTNIHIDHKNMNPLDNRRSNLRICTPAQNAINRPKQKNNTTGFKGVYLRSNGKFRAAIRVDQKLLCIGTFTDKMEAARAYNKAAKKYFGKFARLNEIK